MTATEQYFLKNQLRRQNLLRRYVLNQNIAAVYACINAGKNPAKDENISKIYFAIVDEFGHNFFGKENSPEVLMLVKEDDK